MTLIQAILLGGIYWLWVNEIGSGFNYAFFCYPVTASLWYGLILGDVPTALFVGATIAPLFLGYVYAGAIVPTDRAAAGVISCAAVIAYGMDVNVALALAMPVGLLMAQLHIVKRTFGSFYIRRLEHIIDNENADSGKLIRNVVLWPSLVKVLMFWVPMTLICYFALGSIAEIFENIPQWLMNGLTAVGQIMPALGMGLLLNLIGERKLFPFFLAGFFIAAYTGLNNIGLVLIGLFLAWLFILFTRDRSTAVEEIEDDEQAVATVPTVLQKGDIFWAYVRWISFNETASSYERHMGPGVLLSFLPPMKKLYKDRPAEFQDACRRHLSFFNTEQFWGACVPGIALAMEEQKALGAPIQGEMIESVKASLMGPFAGIGDTIMGGTFNPLVQLFFIPYALEGHWWAALLPMVIITGTYFIVGLFSFRTGYRAGTSAAAKILSSGRLKILMSFLAVLGLFMIGAMSFGLVNITTPIAFGSGEGVKYLQDVLNSLIPGLLSLSTVLFVYYYLHKFGRKAINQCMLILLVVGLVLGAVGFIG